MTKYDASFKNQLKRTLEAMGLLVIIETDVPVANLRTDFVLYEYQREYFLFGSARKYVVGEFKSGDDKFTAGVLRSVSAKALLYFSGNYLRKRKSSKITEIPMSQVSATVVLGGNHKLHDIDLAEFKVTKLKQGQYLVQTDFISHVIVTELSEINYAKEDLFFRIYADSEKQKEFIKDALQDENIYNLEAAVFLVGEELMEQLESVLTEEKFFEFLNLAIQRNKDFMKKFLPVYGIEKVVQALGIEKVVQALGIEKVVQALGIEKIEDYLRKLKDAK